MLSLQTIGYALLGGVLPTLLWLWFWLREDKRRPEPPKLIAVSFILGMLAVVIAIPFEKGVSLFITSPIAVLIGWAIVEEVLKYFAAWAGGMHTQAEDEPIDAMIYLITAALGFAAAENTLFLLDPLLSGELFTTVVTGNIRFIGTTLLHVLSSATIGAAVAFSFYKRQSIRIEHLFVGIVAAVTLHATFNFLIINIGQQSMFAVFGLLWIAIIGLLLVFERVKRIRN